LQCGRLIPFLVNDFQTIACGGGPESPPTINTTSFGGQLVHLDPIRSSMKLFLKTGAVGLFGLLASALPLLAQAEETPPAATPGDGVNFSVSGPAAIIPMILFFAFFVLLIVSAWKIFTKAGQPGWAIFVPIYSFVIFMRIVGRSPWWILFPIILFVTPFDLAKKFGKSAGFGWGLFFLAPIFYPMLAFSDAKYIGSGTDIGSGTVAVAA